MTVDEDLYTFMRKKILYLFYVIIGILITFSVKHSPMAWSQKDPYEHAKEIKNSSLQQTKAKQDVNPSLKTQKVIKIHTNTKTDPCPTWIPPLAFGGVASAEVSLKQAHRWTQFRQARQTERLIEAYRPQKVYQQYRIEQRWIDQGCITISQLVDLGRAIFLRRFTKKEGFGHGDTQRATRSRLQQGKYGGPDASACVDCHWKGGFAGAGDRVDNALVFGDGENLHTQEVRNPLALWGSGWVEILAREMTQDLHQQAQKALQEAQKKQQAQRIALMVQDIPFGWLTVHPDGTWNTNEIEGVDPDLVIKPFGWKGVFPTLRSFVTVSAHKHFNLQAEELLWHPDQHVDLGAGTASDPDQDQVTRELTVGQITALVTFLATLDVPQMLTPQVSMKKEPVFIGDAKTFEGGEFLLRWQEGFQLFEEIGCVGCHVPFMKIKKPLYPLTIPSSDTSSQILWIDLSKEGARPIAEKSEDGYYLLPVFSDFKRHKMGEKLRGLYKERGVDADVYLTRRLWGFAQTSPYLHTGSAHNLKDIMTMHGGEGSEAQHAVDGFFALTMDQKSSLRVFLAGLRRANQIRIR